MLMGCLDLGDAVVLAPQDAEPQDAASMDVDTRPDGRIVMDGGDAGGPSESIDMSAALDGTPDQGRPPDASDSGPPPVDEGVDATPFVRHSDTVFCNGPADRAPPCNGCPDGVQVPPGWVCVPPGDYWVGAAMDDVARTEDDEPLRRVHQPFPFLIQDVELEQGTWSALGADTFPVPAYGRRADTCQDDACPVEQINIFDVMAWSDRHAQQNGLASCYPDIDGSGVLSGGCVDGDGVALGDDGVECGLVEAGVYFCRHGDAPGCTGLRLPTDAEWEIAARGVAPRSDWSPPAIDLEAVAWFGEMGPGATHVVAGKTANGFGLFDVLGNVAEWVHRRIPSASQAERASHQGAPAGIAGARSATRGGHARDVAGPPGPDTPLDLRPAARRLRASGLRSADVGVRLVRSIIPERECHRDDDCEPNEACRWMVGCVPMQGQPCVVDEQCGNGGRCGPANACL